MEIFPLYALRDTKRSLAEILSEDLTRTHLRTKGLASFRPSRAVGEWPLVVGGRSHGIPGSLRSPGEARHPPAPGAGASGDAGFTGPGEVSPPTCVPPSLHRCSSSHEEEAPIHTQSPAPGPGAMAAAGTEKGSGLRGAPRASELRKIHQILKFPGQNQVCMPLRTKHTPPPPHPQAEHQ